MRSSAPRFQHVRRYTSSPAASVRQLVYSMLFLGAMSCACAALDLAVAERPADDAHLVLVTTLDGVVHALEPATGKPIWSFSSGPALVSASMTWAETRSLTGRAPSAVEDPQGPGGRLS